jgi:hypothetical protein
MGIRSNGPAPKELEAYRTHLLEKYIAPLLAERDRLKFGSPDHDKFQREVVNPRLDKNQKLVLAFMKKNWPDRFLASEGRV